MARNRDDDCKAAVVRAGDNGRAGQNAVVPARMNVLPGHPTSLLSVVRKEAETSRRIPLPR